MKHRWYPDLYFFVLGHYFCYSSSDWLNLSWKQKSWHDKSDGKTPLRFTLSLPHSSPGTPPPTHPAWRIPSLSWRDCLPLLSMVCNRMSGTRSPIQVSDSLSHHLSSMVLPTAIAGAVVALLVTVKTLHLDLGPVANWALVILRTPPRVILYSLARCPYFWQLFCRPFGWGFPSPPLIWSGPT